MNKLYFFLIPFISVLLFACSSAPQERKSSSASGLPSKAVSSSNTGQKSPNTAIPLEKGYEAAYQYRTNIPDKLMKNLPRSIEAYRTSNPEEYVRQIAAYIIENSNSDFDKVKKAHDWVALHINYHASAFLANKIPDQSLANVITTGLAVCEGYATVFKALCDEIGIPCVVIHGYGRGIGSAPFADENPSDSNHAWNKVQINGSWYLIDTTWDAGNLKGKSYEPSYTTDYLFLKPEHFIFKHFPANTQDQLLDNPVSASQYPNLAPLRPRFFDTIADISPDLQRRNRVEGKMILSFLPIGDSVISFSVYDDKGIQEFNNVTFVQKEGEIYKAYLSFPDPGNYEVQIFSKKQGEETFTSCGEFGIVSTTRSSTRYPVQYADFSSNTTLLSPLEMPLQKNKSYQFKIKTDKKYVALVIDNQLVHLSPDQGGIFALTTVIPSTVKEIAVVVGDAQYGQYEAILLYAVW
jgi:transglutaminase-like putative cysteine protease